MNRVLVAFLVSLPFLLPAASAHGQLIRGRLILPRPQPAPAPQPAAPELPKGRSAGAELSNGLSREAVILDLEKQRREAILRNDWMTLDRLYSTDYLATTFSGNVRTKAQAVNAFKSGKLKFEVITDDDVLVRTYNHGHTAIVTGRNYAKGKDGDRVIDGSRRFTHVWILEGLRWQMVSSHTSPILKK